MLAPCERLQAPSSLRHTNLTRRIDPRHPGISKILHPQKNMNSEFQNSIHGKRAPFSQNSHKWRHVFWKCAFFDEIVWFSQNASGFSWKIPEFSETIPAYLNFATAHIFFLCPKKLSYSSRNAYIKKTRVRLLGEASSLLKNFKNA